MATLFDFLMSLEHYPCQSHLRRNIISYVYDIDYIVYYIFLLR